MLRFIHGLYSGIEDGLVLIDSNGIGFGIHMSSGIEGRLPRIGEEIRVHTYFRSTQDGSFELFGFLTGSERELFSQIISVNGVGPKAGLNILSAFPENILREMIYKGDSKGLSKAPGVGLKTAQRIVLELKDKLSAGDLSGMPAAVQQYQHSGPETEVIDALKALGYSSSEAEKALKRINSENMSSDELLREALKKLSMI